MKLVPHGDSIAIAVGPDCKVIKVGDWFVSNLDATIQCFDVTGEDLFHVHEKDVAATVELEPGDPANPQDKPLIVIPHPVLQ